MDKPERFREMTSSACEGCIFLKDENCESPVCCIKREINGVPGYTVARLINDYLNYIKENLGG